MRLRRTAGASAEDRGEAGAVRAQQVLSLPNMNLARCSTKTSAKAMGRRTAGACAQDGGEAGAVRTQQKN